MAQYDINFSTNASQIAKELSRVQTELAKTVQAAKPGGLKIKLSLDTADFTRAINSSFKELDRLISQVERKLRKAKIGSPEFKLAAAQSGQLSGERQRGQMMARAIGSRESAQAFDVGSLARYERALESLRIQAELIAPNTKEWVNLQQKIGEITLELRQADKAAESIQLTQQLGALAPGSLSRLEKQLTILKTKAREIAPNTAEWKKLNKEIQNVETSIQKVSKKPLSAGQRAGAAGGAFLYGGGLGGGLGSALGGVAGGLAAGVPGAFAGAALGQLADNIGQALGATASYTAEIDKQRIALKNVTKDVAEYQSALAFIDQTSRSLAIPQDVLNKQFTQLSASVIGAGGNIDLAKEAFIGIAAGIRGTGGSLADMEGALRATAQVFSKGKVSAEELRQQIGERLPGAFTLFAKSMGKTPQELDKMLEQGQVTLNDFMSFVRTLSSEYGASASEIAASSQAAGDRLATAMSRMREAVGRELQPLGAQFQEILANAVADNEENLVALAKAFSQAAQAIGRFIEQYGGLIASLGSTILLIGGTALAVKGIATAYAAIGPAIATATAAIASYGGALSVAKLAMAGLGGPITLTIAGLVLLGKGVYDTNETFRNFVDNIGGVIASDFKNAVDGMAEDAGSSADNIQTAYEDLTAKLEPIGQFIEQLFKDVFKSTSDSAETSAAASSGSFNDFFNSLSTSATEGFNGLNTIISNWWSSLPAPIRNIFGGNAASMLVGAAGYAAALPSRTSQGKPERQGPYLPPNLPNRNAKPTPLGSFPNGSGSGSGTGKAKGAGSKPQTYISDLAKELQRELELRLNDINQDASLSDRERQIQEAATRYDYETLINKAEYYAAVNDESKKDILNRKQYLADLDKTLQAENKLSRQRFEDVVTKPLRSALDEDRQAVIDLEGSIASLAKGQSEQTNIEQRQSLIKKINVGLTEEQSAALKPLFDLLLQTAAARDKLTEAEKRAKSAQEQIKVRNEYIKSLQDEIKLLVIISDEERKLAEIKAEYGEERAQEIFDLLKVKENIEATRSLIDDFVSGTAKDYKGFLKAVISGEDAVDALKQFQAGLTDKVLTIFLDFAMAPVEKFMKESLFGFLKPNVDPKLLEQEKSVNAITANTEAVKALTGAIQGIGTSTAAATDAFPIAAPGGIVASMTEAAMNGAALPFEAGTPDATSAVGAWGDSLNVQLSKSLSEATNTTNTQGLKLSESLGKAVGAVGMAAGAAMGIVAGISQIKEGSTSGVLGGIGSIFMSLGGAIGGFAGMFKGANGGVAAGGWKPFPVRAFANGGMVNGPTLGLVGEGKYNEAIVPLPDGKSIPVQMRGGGGGGGLREAMSGSNGRAGGSPILNMSFQSTNINGVEYVSRDQLEQAMAATRRQAASDGANRGMSMTLDKLQQSPSTRSRLGIGGR
jgi:tape measure domain-containing protein